MGTILKYLSNDFLGRLVEWRKGGDIILSYVNLGEEKRHKVKAKITTNHSASSYGQPVIVLQDGGALDLMSWVECGYQVVKATKKEQEQLSEMGLR